LHKLCQGDVAIDALVAGAGVSYKRADGSYGVSRYALTARAEARLVAHSTFGDLTACAGAVSAKAICQGGNTPFHVDKNGNTTTFSVGGAALAAAFGYHGNIGGLLSACDAAAVAGARHPSAWAQIAAACRHNRATATGNTGSPAACASNIPRWCAENG
ncbi:MAG: hypothetical protein GX945_02320, partial [Lentisphaerae bacterium]|nr:hypothetical protein [Lentisphaerota bacterium]